MVNQWGSIEEEVNWESVFGVIQNIEDRGRV